MKTSLTIRAIWASSALLLAIGSSPSALAEIDSGGVRAIDSGGVRGIDSGGLRAIDSGGLRGIDSGGLRAIDSGGSRLFDISSGSVLEIDSGGIHRLGSDRSQTFEIDSGGVRGIDSGGAHLLSGPITSVDRLNQTFTSLGQVVFASRDMIASVSPGDYVAVVGTVAGPGTVYADEVGVYAQRYIPGASAVYIAGMLSDIDPSVGLAEIGSLQIDYTAGLSRGVQPSGHVAGFLGVQPTPGGPVVATGFHSP